MRFADISTLLFLIVPLVAGGALVFGIWYRRHMLTRMGNPKTVELLLRRPSPYLRAARGISLVLGVAGLVLAASRPQFGGRIQMLKKSGIDVVVALDFSKSMLAQDVRPSRLERAKLELQQFVGQLTGDRIGLVAFAGDTMRFPLTTDYAVASKFWRDLTPYDMPVGGTAIGKALNAAVTMLFDNRREEWDDEEEQNRSKVIVLLTDGEDHQGTPLEVAAVAAEKGVVIHTVGIGSDSPELIPRYLDDGTAVGYQKDEKGDYVTTSLSAENEDVLLQIATKTGGRYFRAGNDLSGLAAVIKEIRNMKQTEIQSRQVTVYEEVFQWFLIPAALFLLIGFVLPERRRGR